MKSAAASDVPSPIPADFRTTLSKVNAAPFAAGGHAGGRFEAIVYVTAAAKDAVFSLSGKIESGTVLVMEQFERGREEPGPILMMEKMPTGFDDAHGDWRYAVVDGASVKVAPESCASCHGEAPHDHVFLVGD